MKSLTSVKENLIKESWYLVDAANQKPGRLASLVAQLLQGKTNPLVRRYHNPKVKVVVINTDKLLLSPKKGVTEFFRSYSGYPGGLKFTSFKEMLAKDSRELVRIMVKGMLPKNKMSEVVIVNLKLFKGSDHNHTAQTPEVIDINNIKF